MFTAVAIMQFVEAGRELLDAPVAAYLPMAPYAKHVMRRRLKSVGIEVSLKQRDMLRAFVEQVSK